MSNLPSGSQASPLRDFLGFLRFLLRRWSEDRCPQVAGSLTFTTLLALAPAFAIAVAMLSSMPFFEGVMVRLKVFLLLNLVPEIAGKIITVYMEQVAGAAGRLTAVSIAVLLVTSLAMLYTVDRTINTIWRVRRGRPLWVSLAGYFVLLLAGPVMVGVSVSATTYLHTLSAGADQLPDEAQSLLLRAGPVAVSAMTFFLVYRIIPYRHVPWRHALLGGLVAAILFEAMKDLFAAYIRAVPTYDLVYGAFAAVPIFLFWVYLSWLVVLLGAEVTACAGYWRGRVWKRIATPGVRFRDALDLGHRLVESRGAPIAFEQLRRDSGVPADELEDLLANLIQRGVVRRERGAGFVLAKEAAEISLADFYAAAVAPGGGMQPQEWGRLSPELERVAGAFEAELKRPLATTLAARDEAKP